MSIQFMYVPNFFARPPPPRLPGNRSGTKDITLYIALLASRRSGCHFIDVSPWDFVTMGSQIVRNCVVFLAVCGCVVEALRETLAISTLSLSCDAIIWFPPFVLDCRLCALPKVLGHVCSCVRHSSLSAVCSPHLCHPFLHFCFYYLYPICKFPIPIVQVW